MLGFEILCSSLSLREVLASTGFFTWKILPCNANDLSFDDYKFL